MFEHRKAPPPPKNSNRRIVEETQMTTITNLKEKAEMNYGNDNLEEVVTCGHNRPTLKQSM